MKIKFQFIPLFGLGLGIEKKGLNMENKEAVEVYVLLPFIIITLRRKKKRLSWP